jgi:hypothetical protein
MIKTELAVALAAGAVAAPVFYAGDQVLEKNVMNPIYRDDTKIAKCADELGRQATLFVNKLPKLCAEYKAVFPYEQKLTKVYTPDETPLQDEENYDTSGDTKTTYSSKTYQMIASRVFEKIIASEVKDSDKEVIEHGILASFIGFSFVMGSTALTLDRRKTHKKDDSRIAALAEG